MNVHQQLGFGLNDIFILVSRPTDDAHLIASECIAPTQFQWIVLRGAENRVDFSQPMQDDLRSHLVLRMERGIVAARRVEAPPGRKFSPQSAGPSTI
jgi:hypothetical protein